MIYKKISDKENINTHSEVTKNIFSLSLDIYIRKDCGMIDVTRLNGTKLTINADLIETVEENPDTVISLINGKKIIVKEDRQEIKNLVKSYKRDIVIN